MAKKRRGLIAVLVAVSATAVLAAVLTVAALAPAPGPPPLGPPTPTPTPVGYVPALPPLLTAEEELRQRAEIDKTAPGTVIRAAGPETAGVRILIRDRHVQLPPDAMLGGVTVGVLCVEGSPCPQSELPAYTILRGQSMVLVSIGSGTILSERVAPGEEGAFDFLREALR